MRFADIIGYEDLKKALVGMADASRVPHALLLYENEGCGAVPLALAFSQYLACEHPINGDSCGVCPSCNRMQKLIHPDLHFVFPVNAGSKSGKTAAKDLSSAFYMEDFRGLLRSNPWFMEAQLSETLGLETKTWDINVLEARELSRELSLSAVENGWKTVLFYLPETLNVAAANKLLKLVEEPPEKTLFLFVTHQPSKVLQTIFSRCQSLRLPPQSPQEIVRGLSSRGYEGPEAEEQARLCGGSLGVALQSLQSDDRAEQYFDWMAGLLQALLKKDLLAALAIGDEISALGSREKQKAFCIFASEVLRKIFLLQRGQESLAGLSTSRAAALRELAGKVSRQFAVKMLPVLDKTAYYIDRNVNQKILFTDLVDRMSLYII
ncbi:MAG: hypothetical protein J6Y32_00815 [Bacteroidales bacterium]|nr:hypothetical protein [Bacteroidales bacterium]